MACRVSASAERSASRRTSPRLPRPPSSTCALSMCPAHCAASAGAGSPARSSTPRGTARPCRRNKAFPSLSARRIMPAPSLRRPAHPPSGDTNMSGPERLPFLDAEPWRVVVINPTGRYARNQVAGLVGRRHAGRRRRRTRPRRRDDGRPAALRPRRRPAGDGRMWRCSTPRPKACATPSPNAPPRAFRTIVAVAEYVPVHDAIAGGGQRRAPRAAG